MKFEAPDLIMVHTLYGKSEIGAPDLVFFCPKSALGEDKSKCWQFLFT